MIKKISNVTNADIAAYDTVHDIAHAISAEKNPKLRQDLCDELHRRFDWRIVQHFPDGTIQYDSFNPNDENVENEKANG